MSLLSTGGACREGSLTSCPYYLLVELAGRGLSLHVPTLYWWSLQGGVFNFMSLLSTGGACREGSLTSGPYYLLVELAGRGL